MYCSSPLEYGQREILSHTITKKKVERRKGGQKEGTGKEDALKITCRSGNS